MSPKPLYQGTAEQMGILPLRGNSRSYGCDASLQSPVTCKNLLREYLFNPPENIANDFTHGSQRYFTKSMHLPDFPVTNPARYVKNTSINTKQVLKFCVIFFRFQKVFSPVIKLVSCRIPHVFMLFLIFFISPFRRKYCRKKVISLLIFLNPVIPLDRDKGVYSSA